MQIDLNLVAPPVVAALANIFVHPVSRFHFLSPIMTHARNALIPTNNKYFPLWKLTTIESVLSENVSTKFQFLFPLSPFLLIFIHRKICNHFTWQKGRINFAVEEKRKQFFSTYARHGLILEFG